ncbi:MAG: hypothetical protein ACI8P0_001300 [Planctomycetaceae bacterium]|jgi:hypothetical protein
MSESNDAYKEGYNDGYNEERFPVTDGGAVNEERAESDSDYHRGVQDGTTDGDSERSIAVGG